MGRKGRATLPRAERHLPVCQRRRGKTTASLLQRQSGGACFGPLPGGPSRADAAGAADASDAMRGQYPHALHGDACGLVPEERKDPRAVLHRQRFGGRQSQREDNTAGEALGTQVPVTEEPAPM
ncbi:hypothetical protein HPB50_000702 [Hyalomma asiaticum]|uniref:Uncharacterized protein n=1 Tax=Hyalomma asiaticum TaxID=266040 RepID=A0ACB7SIH0_HYAAI|nr:hypothetical protein HPB50_000702 [Hyalomma asiaticum]